MTMAMVTTTTTTIHSTTTVSSVANVGLLLVAVLLPPVGLVVVRWWIRRGTDRWNLRVKQFIKDHDGKTIILGDDDGKDDDDDDDDDDTKLLPLLKDDKNRGRRGGGGGGRHKILFIVVPSSGAGKAMDIYQECLDCLMKRPEQFTIEVHATKSSDDIKTLLKNRFNNGRGGEQQQRDDGVLDEYYGLILLGGDSSITELIQQPLADSDKNNNNDGQHNDTTGPVWHYPPILHLPGGSTNVLSKELFPRKSHVEILREFSVESVRRACVMKVSSPSPSINKNNSDSDSGSSSSSGSSGDNTAAVYATHVAFHGIGRHALIGMEQNRHGLYALFGAMLLPFVIFRVLFWPPNRDEHPYYALAVASTKNFAGGNDSGFGHDLFDDQLVMIHVRKFKGPLHYFKHGMIKLLTGELARRFHESSLPEDIEVRMGNQFTITKDHDFHFITDGTTTVNWKGRRVVFQCLPDTIPYFVSNEVSKKVRKN